MLTEDTRKIQPRKRPEIAALEVLTVTVASGALVPIPKTWQWLIWLGVWTIALSICVFAIQQRFCDGNAAK